MRINQLPRYSDFVETMDMWQCTFYGAKLKQHGHLLMELVKETYQNSQCIIFTLLESSFIIIETYKLMDILFINTTEVQTL